MRGLTSQGARLDALQAKIKEGLDHIDQRCPKADNEYRAGFLSGYLANLMLRIGMAYESKEAE